MECEWSHYLILILFVGYCSGHCSEISDQCVCHTRFANTEIQCPPSASIGGGLVLHIEKDGELKIDCINSTELFPNLQTTKPSQRSEFPYMTIMDTWGPSLNIDLLPDMTVDNIYKLEINFCPLPPNNFKSVCDKFALKDVEVLEVESKNFAHNVILTQTYFEGLSTLKQLKLKDIGSIELDENVFANTRHLTNIELQGNCLELKSNLFQPTVSLRSLDISQNELETLPRGVLGNLRNLMALYLRNNKLKQIEERTFADLSNLEALDLSFNQLLNVSDTVFMNLVNLKRIDLSMNNFTALPSNIFLQNALLESVRINHNVLRTLPDYLFSNLHHLREVEITDCNLKCIPEKIFLNSTQLEILNLTNNLLENVSDVLLRGLESLKELLLGNNRIRNVTNMFKFLRRLEMLNLERNEIAAIEENTFADLKQLKELYLGRNQIVHIHFNAFNRDNMNTLKIIDLGHNQITKPANLSAVLKYAILENVVALEDINLSHNRITRVEDVVNINNKINLFKLDLRHNNITNLMIRTRSGFKNKLEMMLDWNNITAVDFHTSDARTSYNKHHFGSTTLSLTNNPLTCTCANYNLFQYFQDKLPAVRRYLTIVTDENCFDPSKNANISVKEVAPSSLLCSINEITKTHYSGCPTLCSCYWRLHDKSIVVDCSHHNFTILPELILPNTTLLDYNQTEINFEYNNLIAGPRPNLTGYRNVTKMLLSNNKIRTMAWLSPKLKILELHRNSLSRLDYEMVQALNKSNFLNLTLSENPWICDCGAGNLTDLLRHRRYVDSRHVFCANSNTLLVNLSRQDLCSGGLSLLFVILPFISVFMLAAVLAALYYKYQQELKVWLYSKNLLLWWVTEEDLDKDKIYDAFVSYSHKDEVFVVQHLQPVLEGEEGYKLCLHYRNWVPGEFIAKQVTTSVCESKRTVVVLSSDFLKSVWGKMEFRTAHTQAMTEGRARVIVVVYGDVDVDGLDGELKSYLKTNTYVKWGDPYFWHKLKYAMPHSRKRRGKRVLGTGVSASVTLDTGEMKTYPNQCDAKVDTNHTEAGALLNVTST